MRFLKKKQIPPIWILGIASGLSPFGMAIVIPALNSISEHFDASFSTVQYVISSYLFGLAIAQPVSGFLCDLYGRRPVMLFGFALFSIASLACAYAVSLEQLVAARFMQAAGVSVGTVASRSILRDVYDRERMGQAMAYIAIAMGIAPVAAPAFGGFMDATGSFEAIFVASAVLGLIIFTKMYLGLSETLPKDIERPEIGTWLNNYAVLLKSRSFVGNTLVFGFVQGSFFCFIAVGALLFLSEFQIGSADFGVLWGGMAVLYVFGAALSARLTPKFGSQKIMSVSVWLGVIAGLVLYITASWRALTVLKVLAPLGMMMLLSGVISPGSLTGAVAEHPTRAGSASGLSSSIGLMLAGMSSMLAGNLYKDDYSVVALLIFFCAIATALSWLLADTGRNRAYKPEEAP